MLDREDGNENRQAKRDRDKIGWLGGVIRRIQLSRHLLVTVRYLVCSWISPQPCRGPSKGKGHDGQKRLMRQENVLGKIQAFERNSEVAFEFRHATRPSE